MTFTTTMNATLTQIVMRTGVLSSQTTFTSEVKTIQFVSEHIGVENEELQGVAASLRYVPSGSGTQFLVYQADHLATARTSFLMNPLSYALLDVNGTLTGFILANSSTDVTATDLVPDDDLFTEHRFMDLQGKRIQAAYIYSGDQDVHMIGFELESDRAGRSEEI